MQWGSRVDALVQIVAELQCQQSFLDVTGLHIPVRVHEHSQVSQFRSGCICAVAGILLSAGVTALAQHRS